MPVTVLMDVLAFMFVVVANDIIVVIILLFIVIVYHRCRLTGMMMR